MPDNPPDTESSPLRRFRNLPKRAADTEEGKARAREYRLALGTFVDAFAKVESGMFYVLLWQTKTKVPVGKAIFSGTRVETASSFLRRLADVGDMDAAEWEQLEPVLTQLHIINDVRNTLLHHVTQGVEDGRALVTDALRALTVDRIRVYPISPAILEAMTRDCRKIFLHLVTRHSGRPALRGKHPELDEVLRDAWRYIPPRPTPPIQRNERLVARASLIAINRRRPRP
jgi:hypothetical protein